MLQPALLGGVVIGVLSALPVINLATAAAPGFCSAEASPPI